MTTSRLGRPPAVYPPSKLFSSIRPDAGAAFIIVVHLDPQRHSELSAIVSARTYMPSCRSHPKCILKRSPLDSHAQQFYL